MLLVDPPLGWKFGFPVEYAPKDGETLTDFLVAHGYPAAMIDAAVLAACRFIGPLEELRAALNRQGE